MEIRSIFYLVLLIQSMQKWRSLSSRLFSCYGVDTSGAGAGLKGVLGFGWWRRLWRRDDIVSYEIGVLKWRECCSEYVLFSCMNKFVLHKLKHEFEGGWMRLCMVCTMDGFKVLWKLISRGYLCSENNENDNFYLHFLFPRFKLFFCWIMTPRFTLELNTRYINLAAY